jgi:uncharacterized protein (TIGR02246 family)
MKILLKSTLSAAGIAAISVTGVLAADDGEQSNIKELLSTYEAALNASNTNAIMQLYADDGVFMAPHSPPNIGKQAVRNAYDAVFDAITLKIDFEVDEITQVAPNWAFARTRSHGFVTINVTGDSGPEANQELFIFARTDDGAWKIARYIFSATTPPRQ